MDDRENAVARRELVSALLFAAEHAADVLRVCGDVSGGADAAVAALTGAFALSEMQASAILQMQVRRFTPDAIERLRTELAEIDAFLGN